MSKRNPYDDYDAIDPWDNTDDSKDDSLEGRVPNVSTVFSDGFEYDEDEIDPIDAIGTNGYGFDDITYRQPSAPPEVLSRGSTDSLPKTMVRARLGDAIPKGSTAAYDQDQILRRRNDGRKAGRSRGRQQTYDPRAQQAGYVDTADQQPMGQGGGPRMPRRRRRRRLNGFVKLLIAIAIVVGGYWLVAHPIDDRLAFTPEEQQTVNGTLSWGVPGMPYYVLALGSDAREGDTYSRTDTMMLVRVDIIGAKLTLVSIPRDTMVQIEGQGTQKINAAYAFGGAGGAVKAVSKLMGVPIHHVAVVHFEELAGLVDYLGGVTVDVPVEVYDPDYTGLMLDEGTQTLDGETALLWARTRYGFTDGDFQRQANQRILLSALMNRMLSLSPAEMPGALEMMGDLIGTDLRCYNLVPLFIRLKLSNPTIYQCSVPSTTDTIDGVSYVIANEEELAEMMRVVNAGGDPEELA